MKVIKAAVLTASDSRSKEDDVSGSALVALLIEFGCEIVDRRIVSDDLDEIAENLAALADELGAELVLTTGGTGFARRDNTPEATLRVIEREAPGIAEAIRRETAAKTPFAMLSRGVAGIRGSTLIINLPGSPKGVAECFDVVRPILPHAIDLLAGHTGH